MRRLRSRFRVSWEFDEEDRRRAAAVLYVLLALFAIVTPLAPFVTQRHILPPTERLTVLLGLMTVYALAADNVRRGRVQLASALLIFTLWVTALFIIILYGGLNYALFLIFPFVIGLAAVTLGEGTAVVMTGLSLTTAVMLEAAEVEGLLPDPQISANNYTPLLITGVLLLANAVLTISSVSWMRAAVRQARANERALRHEKHLTESIINSLPGIFYVYNAETHLLLNWNHTLERRLRYTPLELHKRFILDFFPEESHAQVAEEVRRIRDGAVREVEAEMLTGDGVPVPMLFTGAQVTLQGRPYLIGLGIDITEYRRAQDALFEAETRYRTLVEALADAVVVTDLQGKIIYCNPSTEALIGLPSAEIMRLRLESIVLPEDLPAMLEGVQDFLTSAAANSPVVEYRIRRRDGQLRWVGSIFAHTTFNGAAALQTVTRDITRRKEEEEIRLALARNQERAETFQALVRSISHDLQSPLSTINIGLYVARSVPDPAETSRQLTSIAEQVRHMEQLLRRLALTARLGKEPPLKLAPVALNVLVQDIAGGMNGSVAARALTLLLDLQPDLPALVGDEEELRRVVANLLENAVRYTPEGGTVTVSTREFIGEVRLAVRDTGIGIMAEDLPYIFDRFYRAPHATVMSAAGTGLGLAIVKQIVERHGGRVDVESEYGRGSTFEVWLPVGLA